MTERGEQDVWSGRHHGKDSPHTRHLSLRPDISPLSPVWQALRQDRLTWLRAPEPPDKNVDWYSRYLILRWPGHHVRLMIVSLLSQTSSPLLLSISTVLSAGGWRRGVTFSAGRERHILILCQWGLAVMTYKQCLPLVKWSHTDTNYGAWPRYWPDTRPVTNNSIRRRCCHGACRHLPLSPLPGLDMKK